jgi:hypothetical protein
MYSKIETQGFEPSSLLKKESKFYRNQLKVEKQGSLWEARLGMCLEQLKRSSR